MIVVVDSIRKLIITRINARSLSILTNFCNYEIEQSEKIITQLKFSSLYDYSINSTVITDFGKYKIKTITKDRIANKFIIECCEANLTNIFVLPLLFEAPKDIFGNMFLYNAYLSKDFENLFLVLRSDNSDNYLKMEKDLYDNHNFVEFRDENDFTIFKFKIPEKYKLHINFFINGNYSKFPKIAQDKILLFNKSIEKDLVQIFTKDKERRKTLLQYLDIHDHEVSYSLELLSKPTKREIYTKEEMFK